MISTESYSLQWIESICEKFGYKDKNLLEKVIRAFVLLEMLVNAGAPITFKGGSAILLLLKDSLNRLSIDVDVICPPGTYIPQYLHDLDKHGFIQAVPVRAEHAGKNLPASHSKVFYELAFETSGNPEAFIRLDVLYEDTPYANTVALPLDVPFVKQEGAPVLVKVPSKEDILGDKLTAFGPHSIGIPYFKGNRDCSLDIIKQLFDISRLFDVVTDFAPAYESFKKVSAVELGYRGMDDQIDRYFDDVRSTALCIGTRGENNAEEYRQLQSGIGRIATYMYQKTYHLEEAIDDSAKAAYLATCFQNRITDIQKYTSVEDVADLSIEGLPRRIQRLKRGRPEAFYYWVKTAEMVKLI